MHGHQIEPHTGILHLLVIHHLRLTHLPISRGGFRIEAQGVLQACQTGRYYLGTLRLIPVKSSFEDLFTVHIGLLHFGL